MKEWVESESWSESNGKIQGIRHRTFLKVNTLKWKRLLDAITS
jgi:hypothetical protein